MVFDWKPLVNSLALVLLFVLLASRVCVSCTTTKMTVPTPDLKYMLDTNVHVSWADESGMDNYTANYCCTKEEDGTIAICPSPCPHYSKIESCLVKPNTFPVRHHCTIPANQYLNYSVFLTAEYQGCQFKSKYVEIIPTLIIAYAPEVEHLNMISKTNGLFVKWPEPNPPDFICYVVTCHEMEGPNKGKQVFHHPNVEELTVFIPLKDVRDAFTSYQCCVKVHLCKLGDGLGLPSGEVCNQSKTLPTAPSDAPEILCGVQNSKRCPVVVRNNLRNVTLQWKLPDKSTWNGIPKGIRLEVRKAGQNATTKLFINGTPTEYTLTGLSADVDYRVELRMCNVVDCGPTSTPLVLHAMQRKTGVANGFFSSKLMAIVICSVIVIAALALAACSAFDSRRNHETVTMLLPALSEPVELPGQACSGDSTATSILVNTADYDTLHQDNPETLDTNSQQVNGNGYDASSLESYDAEPSRPLLAKDSERPGSVGKQRVVVTYLPQRHGAVSSRKANLSGDEGPKFV